MGCCCCSSWRRPRTARRSIGTIQNPHDPQAQWAAKDQNKTKVWVGYKVQIAETVGPEPSEAKPKGEPTDQFITEITTTEDFDISVARREAICPAGQTSTQCSRLENTETAGVQYRFEWSYPCDGCPLNSQCTTARHGRRMVLVGEHHDHLQARRREIHTDAFRQEMHQRNGIEGTISEFARNGGRRTRYRGLAKTALANYLHGAAINAKRWIRLLRYRMCPDCPMPI